MKAALGETVPVTLYFYMGLCNAAGWATELDGEPAVLLGVEKIVELGWQDGAAMQSLIYHELGHKWHDATTPLEQQIPDGRVQKVWQLFTEGMAMYVEQLILRDFDFYHQDKDGWLEWCRQNHGNILLAYGTRVRYNESIQDFFGDWHHFQGHSDVGYYLGCEFVKDLLKTHTLHETAGLAPDEIYSDFMKYDRRDR